MSVLTRRGRTRLSSVELGSTNFDDVNFLDQKGLSFDQVLM